ncbi:MAG: leucine-rich repeat protein [Ruminococcus sp.]|nr:leucine-rich repeat protein [Ruminococcus sp.]
MKFTNRIVSLLLCVLMISAVACLSVSASTVYPVGNWVYEKINNNTEFEVVGYSGSSSNVSTANYHNFIPIASIGEYAFLDNSTMSKITLGPNIHSIQNNAFLNAANLKTVVIEGALSFVGKFAFAGCTSLNEINLADSKITTVSSYVFHSCSELTEVTLPDTVTTIEENAFAYCDNLKKIVIPATVTYIDGEAFSGSDNVVIHCYENSLAHRYAVNNNIPYVLLDAKETYLLGDADNDGVVTVLDATLIQLVLASKTEKIDGFDTRADIDNDGVVSILDATSIQQYMAGLLTDSNIGKVYEY